MSDLSLSLSLHFPTGVQAVGTGGVVSSHLRIILSQFRRPGELSDGSVVYQLLITHEKQRRYSHQGRNR